MSGGFIFAEKFVKIGTVVLKMIEIHVNHDIL